MTACYNLNGNQDETLYPCSADGDPIQCCELGQSCASDGLCVNNGTGGLTKYSIYGCTQQNWTDTSVSNCPNNCVSTGGIGVSDCGVGSFCCYGFGGCDCDNSTQTFSLDPVNIIATITGSTTTTSTQSATSTPSSTTTPSTEASTDGSDSSNALPVGLGVGLGVGIPLLLGIIVAALFFCRRRKRAGETKEMAGYQSYAPQADSDNTAAWQQSQSQHQLQSGSQPPYAEGFKPNAPTAPPYNPTQTYELPSTQQTPHELQ
ncbi:hypothetical protein BJX99DRAFT_68929 [Aspergillus californicus]